MEHEETGRGKVVSKLTSQEETLKMASFFARRELSTSEAVFGVMATVIVCGVGLGVVLYLLVGLFLWR